MEPPLGHPDAPEAQAAEDEAKEKEEDGRAHPISGIGTGHRQSLLAR
jgi:hypothetical protein